MRRLPALLAPFAIASAAIAQLPQPSLQSPLLAAPDERVPEHLRASVVALAPDDAAWRAMEKLEHVRIEALPVTPTRTATLLLRRIDPFAADARIVASRILPDGTEASVPLPRPQGQWWIGSVEGADRSKVMLSRSDAGILGFVQDERGTAVIASDGPGRDGPTVSYALNEVPPGTFRWKPWLCEALVPEGADGRAPRDAAAPLMAEPCRQIRVAVETDNELYQRFGGAINPAAAAAAYVGTLFAGIREIYQSDLQILPHVSYLRLWPTADDPWSGASTGAQLNQLRSYWLGNMAGEGRELTAMLSTRGLGGGVAWLSAACSTQWGYSVSADLAGSFPYPLVNNDWGNWDIMVTSHEIGHNVGSPHTHDYCPVPADSCAPDGYFGQCQSQQACDAAGTIMSYCHTCGNGMANIVLDFHPLCVASIASNMSANCNLGADTTSAAAVDDVVAAIQGAEAMSLDPLANDVPVNCEAVTLDSFDSFSARGVVLVRMPGAGPGGRDLIRYAPPATLAGTDSFSYRVREASGLRSLPATVTIDLAALRLPENPTGDAAGLDVRYFQLSAPTALPDFSTLAPYLSSASNQVNVPSTGGNFAGSGRADDVGAAWTGWLRVDAPGLYTLYVDSDDGSRLWIGDRRIVDNDGLHGMVERSGQVALAAGKHALRIEFFEAGGGAGCIASIAGPGLAKQVIPASRLTRGGTVNRYDLNHDGRVDGADLGILLGAWGSAYAPADFDGSGSISGADLGLLLGAWST
jgi:hypothetical protein